MKTIFKKRIKCISSSRKTNFCPQISKHHTCKIQSLCAYFDSQGSTMLANIHEYLRFLPIRVRNIPYVRLIELRSTYFMLADAVDLQAWGTAGGYVLVTQRPPSPRRLTVGGFRTLWWTVWSPCPSDRLPLSCLLGEVAGRGRTSFPAPERPVILTPSS